MKAGDGTKLGEVLRKYSTISVEDYQRSYSWQNDDVDDFFGDLLLAASPEISSHFFGTLIFQEVEGDETRVTVVDGQQRITTIYVTLAAIRDAVLRLSVDTIPPKAYGMAPDRPAEEATKLIVSDGKNSNFFRYEANRFIRPIMEESVFSHPDDQKKIAATHKQVTLAFRHAVRRIRSKLLESLPKESTDLERLAFLNSLLTAITEKFRVLTIETDNLSESLDIFLTLNDRGQELGPSDIVKGKLMAALGRGQTDLQQMALQEKINREWTQLSEDVREPETFLRHYLISTGVEAVQKKAVVNEVDKRMKGKDEISDLDASKKFWKDLRTEGVHYTEIIGAAVKDTGAKLHLKLLEGLQKSHRIFLMAVFSQSSLREGKALNEIVRLTFVLSFRWVAAERGRQLLEDTFQGLAMAARGVLPSQSKKSAREPATGEELVEALKKLVEDFNVDFHKVMSRDVDGSFLSRAALYYAQYLTVGSAVAHDLKDLHLEHIAPQTKTSEWEEELFPGNTDKSKYEDVISSIGNLTLLDPTLNHKLGNKPFWEKRQEYEKSSMFLTTNLTKFESWTEAIVAKRTLWVSEVFSLVCSVAGPNSTAAPFADWYSKRESGKG